MVTNKKFNFATKREIMTAKEDKEKEKIRKENLNKFIYQLAHTCFTAMVIVAVVFSLGSR